MISSFKTASPKSIHIFTADVLPFAGCPRTAGGNRSMQFISALRNAGHTVTFSMPLDGFIARQSGSRVLDALSKDDIWACENFYNPEVVLNRIQPDICITCNVNTFRTVPRFPKDILQVVDLNGPVHLEGLFIQSDFEGAMQNGQLTEMWSRVTIDKLRWADYVITVSERQRYFWSAYCASAGFSFEDLNVIVCPPSYDVPSVPRNPSPHLTVVHSGGFYPWQRPDRFLRAAAAALEPIENSVLHIFGTPHEGIRNESEVYALLSELQRYRCVQYHGYKPIEELLRVFSTAWCALDLMEQNFERELAVGGRTVVFLSSGVPVIYGDFASLSRTVNQYNAGWTVSRGDEKELGSIFSELIAGGPQYVEQLSENARRLAKTEFQADRNMLPLLQLCEDAPKRRRRSQALLRTTSSTKSLGRALFLSPGQGALSDLRINNPLRSLHRQGYLDAFSVAHAQTFPELQRDERTYDLVLTQRTLPFGTFETLGELGVPFLLDIDDNLLAPAAYRDEKIPDLGLIPGFKFCKALTAPTPRLVQGLEKYSHVGLIHKAFVTPNALPFPRAPKTPTQPAQIIWIQSDIAALDRSREDVVRAVSSFSEKVKLPVVLIGPTVLSRPAFKHQVEMGGIDFTSNLQLLEFAPTSIGVAPLETDSDATTLDFIAGKSDLKILLFAGYGHAGVYSAAPPYTDSKLRRGLSVVENSYESWMDSLEFEYKEGWRKAGEIAAFISSERHIDQVARESWLPALEACVLPHPIKGSELSGALEATWRNKAAGEAALAYKREAERLQGELNQVQNVLTSVLISKSWRVTAPLRSWSQSIRGSKN